MKYQSLRQTVPRTVFFAVHQSMSTATDANTYVVRTPMRAADAAGSIATALTRIDPAVRVTQMRTLSDHVARSLLRERLLITITGAFGLLSLVLVSVGVYGVVAFQVSRRTKEMGIRLALGARPAQLITLVLRETVMPVLAGTLIGVAAAWPATQVAQTMLFGVRPTDPVAVAGACASLVTLALFAAWLPGRRAAHLDPATTLRSD